MSNLIYKSVASTNISGIIKHKGQHICWAAITNYREEGFTRLIQDSNKELRSQPLGYTLYPGFRCIGLRQWLDPVHALLLYMYAHSATKLCVSVASTKIFGTSVMVSDHDCDKQPSYEYC